jgi:hypothetical protein
MPATPSQSKPVQAQPAMQVPLLDLKPQYRPLAAEIQAVIEKVCANQGFIPGPAAVDYSGYERCAERFSAGGRIGCGPLSRASQISGLTHRRAGSRAHRHVSGLS